MMNRIALLKNVVKEYSWGSYTAIPALLGKKPPYNKPQAELWMGAHPSGSSMIKTEKGWESLDSLIKKYPDEIIGKSCEKKYGSELPFLFKVIAASEPLSIQAHPNRAMARNGFRRENKLGIPVDSFRRNYRDENHKPELLCALTDFEALCGFRRIRNIIDLFRKTCPKTLGKEIKELEKKPDSSGLRIFINSLMKVGGKRKKGIISEAAGNAVRFAYDNPVFYRAAKLIESHPEDIGALSPLYMNLVRLSPGQAIFIRDGQLHTYLEGVALELMACSDNVVRGGLTKKHVDLRELFNIVNFRNNRIRIIMPEKKRNEYIYKTPAREFLLSKIEVNVRESHVCLRRRNAEIILCTEGRVVVTGAGNRQVNVSRGKAFIVPASVKSYRIDGNAILYKAQTPL